VTERTTAASGRNATLVAGIWIALAIGTAGAQTAPTGLWRTIDDATGKPKSLVRIVEQDGVLSGRIERLFDPDPKWDGRCDRCRDERKDQPVLGMTILTNMRKDRDGYSDGEILDPENGHVYRCRLRVAEGGTRLEVRGFVGLSLFGRTQVWLREQ
jgi:uncharacterized protein (DUF2147 family)